MGVVVSEYRPAAPTPALARFVAGYGGYRDAGGPPATHRGLPSPYLTFIVTLDEPLTMLVDGRREAFPNLVAGLHTAPVTIVHEGRQSGVQISLHPLGARALFGCPAGVLGPANLVAADVAPGWVDELQDRVRSAVDWPSRFAACDAVLLAVLQPATVSAPLRGAWHALSVEGWSVGAVAEDLGWGARRLSREFGAEYGVAPKVAARLGRFDRARREVLRPGRPSSLAAVAARHGYFDQAHLTREFREFAGVAPSTWVAEERRSVQADAVDTVAGSGP